MFCSVDDGDEYLDNNIAWAISIEGARAWLEVEVSLLCCCCTQLWLLLLIKREHYVLYDIVSATA